MSHRVNSSIFSLTFIERLIFGTLILGVLFLFFVSIAKPVFPHFTDEGIYYNSARLFNETYSLKAPEAIEENRSRLGEFNWYGPAYHLIYGSLAKIFGLGNKMFFSFHLTVFFIGILLLLIFPITNQDKGLLGTLFVCSHFFTPFIFTFFPETIHVTAAILLLYTFTKSFESSRYVKWFLILVLLFILLRVTFVFWILGVLFIPTQGVSKLTKLAIVALFFAFAVLFWYFVCAPPARFVAGMNGLQMIDQQGSFKIILTNFHSNILLGLSYAKELKKEIFPLFIFVFLTLLLIPKLVSKNLPRLNKKQIYGILLISSSLLLAMTVFYTVKPHFIEKQLTVIIPALLFALVISGYPRYVLLSISLLVFLPFTYSQSKANIEMRQNAYQSTLVHESELQVLASINEKMQSEDEVINVLYQYNEYNLHGFLSSCFLPLSKNQKPILYTTNYISQNAPSSERYKVHGRIKVHYIITREPLLDSEYILEKEYPFNIYLYALPNKMESILEKELDF